MSSKRDVGPSANVVFIIAITKQTGVRSTKVSTHGGHISPEHDSSHLRSCHDPVDTGRSICCVATMRGHNQRDCTHIHPHKNMATHKIFPTIGENLSNWYRGFRGKAGVDRNIIEKQRK